MAFLPGPSINVPKEIEEELIALGSSPDVPKKEKVGTTRVLTLRPGMTLAVENKRYKIVKIKGNRLFARYIGDEQCLNG